MEFEGQNERSGPAGADQVLRHCFDQHLCKEGRGCDSVSSSVPSIRPSRELGVKSWPTATISRLRSLVAQSGNDAADATAGDVEAN